MKPFDPLKRGSNVFVTYYSKVLEIVFLENYSKDKFDDRIRRFINFSNYENYKSKDSIQLKTTEEWFHHKECSNSEIFFQRWEGIVTNAMNAGKEGIRILVETNKFMTERIDNALIIYDKVLQDLYDFPITSMYIYKKEDIQLMTPEQIAILNSSRGFNIDELLVRN